MSSDPRDQYGRRLRRSSSPRARHSPSPPRRRASPPRRRRSPSPRPRQSPSPQRRPSPSSRRRRSPAPQRRRSPPHRTSKASYDDRFGRRAVAAEKEIKEKEEEEEKNIVKEKFNLNQTGLLDVIDSDGHELNGGVRLQYHEPHDAALSDRFWRLYVFKDGAVVDTLHLHRKSCYRLGRERHVADIPVEHPSCSKQHAAIQFRKKTTRNVVGDLTQRVCPYVIDLGSTNGTFLNDERIESARFYELLEKDCLKFGQSSRQYIVLHADSETAD